MNFFNPVVQQRISKTLMYFGSGLGATAFLTYALRNSSLAYMNPFLFLALSIGTLIGTMATNYQTSSALKHTLWVGFMSTMALSLVPLI